jgi:hypothetical protein
MKINSAADLAAVLDPNHTAALVAAIERVTG